MAVENIGGLLSKLPIHQNRFPAKKVHPYGPRVGLCGHVALMRASEPEAVDTHRVQQGKTEHLHSTDDYMKQGINRTTLYRMTLRYNLQQIHACKMFGLTAHHHRNTAQ